jgi:uncharacterized protein (UPF0548 family)
MLRPFRASESQKEKLLAAAREAAVSSPQLLTFAHGALGTPPEGFVHEHFRSEVGRGLRAFQTAREAFQKWKEFDLGWVEVAYPLPEIALGELVAVEAHTACLWSINFNRIVEVVDNSNQFGFIYSTTAFHVEEGQERFAIDFDAESESVLYVIEAVSRPRHLLARIGYPFSRAMQHRFVRDSHARMKLSVSDPSA